MVNQKLAVATLLALFVTFLWSTSYVLIIWGLHDEQIPPLVFAGLRYFLGFFVLAIIWGIRNQTRLKPLKSLERKDLLAFAIIGIAGYALEPGLRYLGMDPNFGGLPALSSGFISNFNPVLVLFAAILVLKTRPTRNQIGGLIIAIIGAGIYFLLMPGALQSLDQIPLLGIILTLGAGIAWAIYQIVSKMTVLDSDPLSVTMFSMGVGSITLLIFAVLLEGFPSISPTGIIFIAVLGLVNTAFAYFLWTYSLQLIGAFEATVLQNSMIIQIAFLSMLFLNQSILLNMVLGILFVIVGVLTVQLDAIKYQEKERANKV